MFRKIISLLSILFFSATVFGQQERQCRKLPVRDFFLNLRMEAPAELTGLSDNTIFYNISTNHQILTGLSFDVDDETLFPIGFEKDFRKGLSVIVYCADTREVIEVYLIGQEGKVKFESKKEMDKRIAKYLNKS